MMIINDGDNDHINSTKKKQQQQQKKIIKIPDIFDLFF